jgi:hypothetical protein
MKLHPLIDMCMCYGKTGGKWPILLICPNEKGLKELAVDKLKICATVGEGVDGKA